MTKNLRVLAIALLAVLASLVAAPAALASWQNQPSLGATRNPIIVFDTTNPTALQSPVLAGAGQWNTPFAVSSGAYFSYSTASPAPFSVSTAPGVQVTGITSQAIDGPSNVLADARTWVFTSDPSVTHSGLVRYDSAESWYDSTGTSIGASQYDRWGISTHEFGHILDIAHTANGTQWCTQGAPRSNTSVMCPGTGAGLLNFRYPFAIDRGSYAEIYGGS
jgi:hypothetical protein